MIRALAVILALVVFGVAKPASDFSQKLHCGIGEVSLCIFEFVLTADKYSALNIYSPHGGRANVFAENIFRLDHNACSEAMAQEVQTGEVLEGHVEIDGAYFGGHVRPANAKVDRVDRRLKENQTGKRRVVVALREREGRTLPFIAIPEGEGVALANENVSRMATMSADEASHWDELHMGWKVDRVNHSEIYSDHGKHTNMVESYFSRLRRMVQGQHHHVSPQYLHQYANHAAWLEDNRRSDNGELAHRLGSNSMDAPVSRQWKGYWQRAA